MNPLTEPPVEDDQVRRWLDELGIPGLVDVHTHFLPERVLRKIWEFFDNASTHYGIAWPVRYRQDESDRLRTLRELGVGRFAPLVYAHKPGMAEWLTSWAVDFGQRTEGAVPTATIYPEPGVCEYLRQALENDARCVKVHVQVGGFDPRDELLDPAWGMLAEAGVPVVVHCGHGPIPGNYTGMDVFEAVLDRHPRLVAVLAHAGMPDYARAVELVERFPRVHLDTTMVGTAFAERLAPLPTDWTSRLAEVAERVVLGSDFPNIPYAYAEQLAAISGWAAADGRLGMEFLRSVLYETPSRLLQLQSEDVLDSAR